jgi:hypothetical protein
MVEVVDLEIMVEAKEVTTIIPLLAPHSKDYQLLSTML